QAGMSMTRIASPSLAGALIAVSFIDIQGVYAIQAVLNLLALLLVAMIRLDRRPKEGAEVAAWASRRRTDKTMTRDMFDGLRYIVGNPILLTLVAMALVPTLVGQSYQNFMPVFAKEVFGDGEHRNSAGLGILVSVSGVGALVGSLVVASMQDYPRRALVQ